MPGRKFLGGIGYRYAYQSQEKDDEIYGEGNAASFKYRLHDVRIGRFLSTDPLESKYAGNSPYSFAQNKVNFGNELEGLESIEGFFKWNKWVFNQFGWGDSRVAQVNDALDNQFSIQGRVNQVTTAVTAQVNAVRTNFNEHPFKATLYYGVVQSSPILNSSINGTHQLTNAATTLKTAVTTGDPKAIAQSIDYGVQIYCFAKVPSSSTPPLSAQTFTKLGGLEGDAGLVNNVGEVNTSGVTNISRSSLNPTHYITKSRTAMRTLVNDIRVNGIQEPIKYVDPNGVKYIVDGNHRFYAAQRLGIQNVPVQQVQLPFAGYKTVMDLMMEPGKQPGFWNFIK